MHGVIVRGAGPGDASVVTGLGADELAALAGIAVALALYAVGARRLRAAGGRRALGCWAVAAFVGGVLAVASAVVSPLHDAARASFAAHMVQHEILMLVAPPLIVLGRPWLVWLWALPAGWRGSLRRLARASGLRVARRALAAPFSVWVGATVVFLTWHVPAAFAAALGSPPLHALQHASFLGAAVASWEVALASRYGRLGYGLAVVWLFATALYTGLLGALLTVSPVLWYPAGVADPVAALRDQQLGGLIMWVPAGVAHAVAGLLFFAAWLRALEQRSARASLDRDRAQAAPVEATTAVAGADQRSRPRAATLRVLGLVAIVAIGLGSCGQGDDEVVKLTGGDPSRGRHVMVDYGCQTCHHIPGVHGANGTVGPPLDRMALRGFVAGRLQNSPENLIRWIRDPQSVDPKNAMPNTGVTERDARDIAGYLYTLR